jgi:putative Mn2+ efflux pump MntP
MSFEQVIFLIGFSFAHVFFPGHPTPLLLATGSMTRKNAWKLTFGMAAAHGLLDATALGLGQFVLQLLSSTWPAGKFYLTNLDIPILTILGIFLVFEAFRRPKNGEGASHKILNFKYPFLVGAGVGFIPGPDTIGYAMVGGALGLNGLAHALTATSVVFIGTALGFCSVTLATGLFPSFTKSRKLSSVICGVTALLCFASVGYRTWNTWNDWV